MSGLELYSRPKDSTPKLWDPFIGFNNVFALVGNSDTGKSTLLRQLALTVAKKETEFLGFPLNCKSGKVIYVSLEETEEDISDFLHQKIDPADKDHLENIQFIFGRKENDELLELMLWEFKPDLVVIDPWSELMNGYSNSLTDVRKTISTLREFSREYGCPFIFIHHTVKNAEKHEPDKNKVNGSQGIEAVSRLVMELRNDAGDPSKKYLSFLKGNKLKNSIKQQSLILQFDEDLLNFSLHGKVGLREMPMIAKKKYEHSQEIRNDGLQLKKEGRSFQEIRTMVARKYGEEQTPGLTWFKENCRHD